jgi:hypothetical protein
MDVRWPSSFQEYRTGEISHRKFDRLWWRVDPSWVSFRGIKKSIMQRPTLPPHQVIGFGHLPCSRFRCEDEPQLSQLGGMVQRLVILAERHGSRAVGREIPDLHPARSRT